MVESLRQLVVENKSVAESKLFSRVQRLPLPIATAAMSHDATAPAQGVVCVHRSNVPR
jgi:hypothetical protein